MEWDGSGWVAPHMVGGNGNQTKVFKPRGPGTTAAQIKRASAKRKQQRRARGRK